MTTVREGIRELERFGSTITHIGMFGEDIYGLRNRSRPTNDRYLSECIYCHRNARIDETII